MRDCRYSRSWGTGESQRAEYRSTILARTWVPRPSSKRAAGHGLQIPGGDGHGHGAAGEGNQYPGAHQQALGGIQGQARQQQAVVHCVGYLQTVVTHGLGPRRVGANLAGPHILRRAGEYLEHR